ncbi:hypothetical protein HYZ64_00265 [Candidatus Berkelbacteria bacterium]|nr:hypothetical protein [Candidatus Berkelbacteria bacterium]
MLSWDGFEPEEVSSVKQVTLVVLMIGIVISFTIGNSAPAGEPEWKLYQNRKLGLTIKHPSEWKIEVDANGVYFKSNDYRQISVIVKQLNVRNRNVSLTKLLKQTDRDFMIEKTEQFIIKNDDRKTKEEIKAMIGYGHHKVEELIVLVTKARKNAYHVIVSDPDTRPAALARHVFQSFKITN